MKKLFLFLTLLIAGITANAQYSPSNNLNYIKLLKVPPVGAVEDSVLVYDGSDSFVKMRPSSVLIGKATATKTGTVKTDVTEADPVVYTKNTTDELLDLKTTLSAGAFSGFAVTNNGDGTISVGPGIAYLRATNDQYAPLIKYPIAAVTNLALTDNANNYVLVDYNGGSPTLTVTTNASTINTQTNSLAYVIARVGNDLEYLSLVGQNVDPNAKLRIRFLNQEGIRRASGAVLGFSNRNLTLTSSVLFSGLIRINAAAFNTASPDTFTLAYNNGSVWTRTTGQTEINNTQYNVSGTLTTMPNNTFRTDYVYLLPNNPSKLYVIIGNTTYSSLTLAKGAPRPSSLPVELQVLGLEVGRLFIEKNSAAIAEVQSSFSNDFIGAAVPEHNSLTGLQGGTSGEYNHLTNAQVTLVNAPKTLQYSYDNGSQITTSPSNGAVAIRRGSAADSDNILVGQNNAGTNTFSVTGAGGITGGTYNGYVPANDSNVVHKTGSEIKNGALNISTSGGVTPLAPIHVGNRNVLNSSNAQILVAGNYNDSVTGNGHAFSDGSSISKSGLYAYASYDARVDISGTGVLGDHYVGFQHAPVYTFSGSMASNWGLYTTTAINSGFIAANYGVFAANPNKTGTGDIGVNYGFYIQNQTSGTTNYSIFSEGGLNHFGGGIRTEGGILANAQGNNIRFKFDGTDNDGGILAGGDGSFYFGNWTLTRGLKINPSGSYELLGSGALKIPNLSGTGTRTVVADASGNLSATNTLNDISLTGTPTAPTATAGTNTTQIATTAFVTAAVGSWTDYTPTVSSILNLTSVNIGASGFKYKQEGNLVTVTGNITSSITAANTATGYNITLPISRTNATSVGAGTGSAIHTDGSGRSTSLGVYSSSTTTAGCFFYPPVTGANTQFIELIYDITK